MSVHVTAPPPPPGTRTRVGKYEIGRTLGEGSFAKVKYARNVDNGDSVAIKIIDRDYVLRHKMVDPVRTPQPFLSLSLSLFISFLSLFPIQLSITSFYLYTYILDTMYTLSFYIYIDEKYLLMPEFELVIETCYDLVYIIRGNNFWILKIIHKV